MAPQIFSSNSGVAVFRYLAARATVSFPVKPCDSMKPSMAFTEQATIGRDPDQLKRSVATRPRSTVQCGTLDVRPNIPSARRLFKSPGQS
eukprot:4964260-Alexandrium_andersonii.AAC.1